MLGNEDRYLKEIKDRVDELILKYGYGELEIKIIVKDSKPIYVVFVKSEGRIKLD